MRIIICGGRNYYDHEAMFKALDKFREDNDITMIIHGDANGADRLGKVYALENGIHCATIPALWRKHGDKAGHLRNAAMLPLAEYVIAFPGGAGTANMIRIAEGAGVPVWCPFK